MNTPIDFFDQTPDRLAKAIAAWGMPAYRAEQIFDWVYRKSTCDPQQMTNLAKADRHTISEHLKFSTGRIVRQQSASDGTQKLLIEWSNNATSKPSLGNGAGPRHRGSGRAECVLIPSQSDPKPRRTACVSSQFGCPVGCRFCASGLEGLEANLTTGQIVEQVWQLNRLTVDLKSSAQEVASRGVSHIVFMGMGEPLSNFQSVTDAIRTLVADWGMGLSARRITVSTVGLPAQIRRLADLGLPVTLALSVHAPNDQIRRNLIPWAEYVTIDQLIEAGQYFFQRTGREVTLEYTLLANVNDHPEHARELASVAKRLRSNINLIRYNQVAELPYRRPTDTSVHQFQRILRRAGVNAHIRASRGRDIAAACGQLRIEEKAAK